MWDIHFEANVQDEIVFRRLPVAICVLAEFSGTRCDVPRPARRFVRVTRENFDDVLAAISPMLDTTVQCVLEDNAPTLHLSLCFRSLADFDSANAARQIKILRDAIKRRNDLSNLLAVCSHKLERCLAELMRQTSPAARAIAGRAAILDAMGNDAPLEITAEGECAAGIVETLLEEIAAGKICENQPLVAQLTRRIEALSQRLTAQLRAVSESYQILYQRWAGLHRLVTSFRDSKEVKVRILDVDVRELSLDLYRLDDGKSEIARLIRDSELGCFGGEPFSLVVLDHLFRREPRDIDLLEGMGRLCNMCSSVLVAGVAPHFFGVRDLKSLSPASDIDRLLASDWFSRWNELRTSEFAPWVILTFPEFTAENVPITGCWRVATTLACYLAGLSSAAPKSIDEGRWPDDVRRGAARWGFCLPDLDADQAPTIDAYRSAFASRNALLTGRIDHHVTALIRERAEAFSCAAEWQTYVTQWMAHCVFGLRNSFNGELNVSVDLKPKAFGIGAHDLTITISASGGAPLKITRTIVSDRLIAEASFPKPRQVMATNFAL